MAKQHDVVDRLLYFALRVVAAIFHCFPINANLKAARVIGSFGYRIDRRHRKRALANLRRSFPEMSEKEIDNLARRSLQSLAMFAVEILFTTRLIKIDTWNRYVDLENFRDVVQLLVKRDGGLILITGHYGNFEVLGYTAATLGFPTSTVARPLDNPYVGRWLFDVREKQGQKIIAKKGATSEVTEVLDNKGVIAFVADQNAGTKGIFVDFFGRKASTFKSIGLLAMQYEAPVAVAVAQRLGRRFRFKIIVQDIIYPADWKDENDPLRYITQRYNKALEDVIRTDPSQYWWVHRRWKTRPKGEEPEVYD
jgi:Kdo2-lipid IVA lauroyltransferase/acyltransferase